MRLKREKPKPASRATASLPRPGHTWLIDQEAVTALASEAFAKWGAVCGSELARTQKLVVVSG